MRNNLKMIMDFIDEPEAFELFQKWLIDRDIEGSEAEVILAGARDKHAETLAIAIEKHHRFEACVDLCKEMLWRVEAEDRWCDDDMNRVRSELNSLTTGKQ